MASEVDPTPGVGGSAFELDIGRQMTSEVDPIPEPGGSALGLDIGQQMASKVDPKHESDKMKPFISAWESVTYGAATTWYFLTQTIPQHVSMKWLQALAVLMGLLTCYHILVMCGVVSYGGLFGSEAGIADLDPVSEIFATLKEEADRLQKSMLAKGSATNDTKDLDSQVPVIDALQIYPKLDFQNPALTNDHLLKQRKKLPLKIILSTYFQHEQSSTDINDPNHLKDIDNALEKLKKHPNLTLQFSEISVLRDWWSLVADVVQQTFHKFLANRRIEIVPGGWTSTDESMVNLYSMIDQLIQAQQWVMVELHVAPHTSWTMDTRGHGSVFPYLLSRAGINSSVMTGVHYAWEKYFAENENGDFFWAQRWKNNTKRKEDVLVHQHRCDLGRTTDSDSSICSKLSNLLMSPDSKLGEEEIRKMADLLVKAGEKAGSLFEHNVALITIPMVNAGNSSAEDHMIRIVEYIRKHDTEHKGLEIEFGTLRKYFMEIKKRQEKFPRFVGDLIPYSNGGETEMKGQAQPNVEVRPYWSGSYSSRPFFKKLQRETESMARDTEILFSFVNMATRQQDRTCFNREDAFALYQDLQFVRHSLAQSAQYDRSMDTTNSSVVLEKYGSILKEAQDKAAKIQEQTAGCLVFLSLYDIHPNFTSKLATTWSRPTYMDLPTAKPVTFESVQLRRIVLFNSFAWRRAEFVTVPIEVPAGKLWILVSGPNKKFVQSQLVPVLEYQRSTNTYEFSETKYNLMFMAELEPLALSIYTVENQTEWVPFAAFHVDYTPFSLLAQPNLPIPPKNKSSEEYQFEKPKGEISIINGRLKLRVNPKTGFTDMRTMIRGMDKRTWVDINLSFGSYAAEKGQSSLNVFQPKKGSESVAPFTDIPEKIYLIRGTLTAELIIIKSHVIQTLRLLHTTAEWEEMENSVYIQNQVKTHPSTDDFFMRFDSNLNSTGGPDNIPEFYTDQSGFSFEKRVKVKKAGLAGNYYPVNTMGYLQDVQRGFRLSLLVDRAHGMSSFKPGRLEVLIDRYVEGETSPETISNYVMLLEDLYSTTNPKSVLEYKDTFPTMLSHHLSQTLSYPVPIYLTSTIMFDRQLDIAPEFSVIPLFTQDFPCNTHLVNLRTMFEISPPRSRRLGEVPRSTPDLNSPTLSSLMILQNLGYSYDFEKFKPDSCNWNEQRLKHPNSLFYKETSLTTLRGDVHPLVTDLSGLRKMADIHKTSAPTDDNQRLEDLKSEPFEITSLHIRYDYIGRSESTEPKPPPSV